MKKVLGIAIAIVVIAIIILFFCKGLGLGGEGSGEKTSATPTKQETEKPEPSKEPDKPQESVLENEEIAKVIIVTIRENQVFVGNKEFGNEAELKKYVEEINNDERQFKLKEEKSILDTYEWVTKVFTDLKIQLVPVAE